MWTRLRRSTRRALWILPLPTSSLQSSWAWSSSVLPLRFRRRGSHPKHPRCSSWWLQSWQFFRVFSLQPQPMVSRRVLPTVAPHAGGILLPLSRRSSKSVWLDICSGSSGHLWWILCKRFLVQFLQWPRAQLLCKETPIKQNAIALQTGLDSESSARKSQKVGCNFQGAVFGANFHDFFRCSRYVWLYQTQGCGTKSKIYQASFAPRALGRSSFGRSTFSLGSLE